VCMYAQTRNLELAQPGHLNQDTELNSISMHGRKEGERRKGRREGRGRE